MKVIVTGANGQLGRALLQALNRRGIPCAGTDIDTLDLTDEQAVYACVQAERPDVIVHCAAYTAVDRAESEPEACMKANAWSSLFLARAAMAAGARLALISSDYVFDGEGSAPWEVSDERRPLNVYGLSKLQAEEAVRSLMTRCYIVRTSWLYSAGGNNFLRTMLRLGKQSREVRVVCDQIGSPTYAPDLAAFLCSLIRTERYGFYHATNEGWCSWADFAQAIFDQAGLRCTVTPIPSVAYPTPARRPMNSRLSKRCLDERGFDRLPPWEDGLRRCLMELRLQGEIL